MSSQDPKRQRPAPAPGKNLHDRTIRALDISSQPPLTSQPDGKRQTAPVNQTLAQRHQDIKHLDQCMLDVLYGHAPVTDCQLLDHMARRNVNFDYIPDPDAIQINDRELAEHLCAAEAPLARRLIRCLPSKQRERLMQTPRTAGLLLRYFPWSYDDLPQEMKTQQFLGPLLDDMPRRSRHVLLQLITQWDPELTVCLETIEEAINRDAGAACATRGNELTTELRRLAVQKKEDVIAEFDDLGDPEYGRLCDLALEHSGRALKWIRPSYRSETRVEQALKHRHPPGIEAIPSNLHTSDRLRDALPHSASILSCDFLNRWNLWETLKKQCQWLRRLPIQERTPELCREYLSQFPDDLSTIPTWILEAHPEWRIAEQPWAYLGLDKQSTRLPSCYGPGTGACASSPASDTPLDEQPWALLHQRWDRQIEKLPQECRQAIRANGGTGGLAQILKTPSVPIDPDALLDPVQKAHCSRRAGALPDIARTHLMNAQSFDLPRAREGLQLRTLMDRCWQNLQHQLKDNTLPHWRPEQTANGSWQLRGGRTLVHTGEQGSVHMKLHRQGESLATFAAEQAAQDFARTHPGLGWHSEIPCPEDMHLVPLDQLPLEQGKFPDKLEIYNYDGKDYALAFRFTTRDDSYDTLAWQPDDEGGFSKSREGLLKAFHDLGVWSSLGAVHTSTIRLYHHFLDEDRESRPELLLSAFFQYDREDMNRTYPGTLHLWNTKATDQSDWGQSGLRDLGDQEFYPFIETYITSADAQWVPPDYGQRASFVNAIAQNILGGLLHYMRLHRAEDPAWHYKTADSVTDLEKFIEDGCNDLLGGLLNDGTQLKHLFAATVERGEEAYPQWLHNTAREIIYWSAQQDARQESKSDCFAQHLNKDHRPSPALYPGHPQINTPYGKHFTEASGENLGANNSKFPLFYLVRGLYVLAAGLADRLGQSQPSQSMETQQTVGI